MSPKKVSFIMGIETESIILWKIFDGGFYQYNFFLS
jgi:hypothetical protein